MRVAEIYDTIQGEGLNAGIPMTFVRLQGCSVGCPWCDTKPTWDSTAGVDMGPEEIVSKCSLPWVCLTGGEPAEQDCGRLTALLYTVSKKLAVETSGEGNGLGGPITHLTLSPKVAVFPDCRDRVNPSLLRRADELKFVIGKPADLDAAVRFVAGGGMTNPTLLLQPVSQSERAARLCVDFILANPTWRLSTQTHKHLGLR